MVTYELFEGTLIQDLLDCFPYNGEVSGRIYFFTQGADNRHYFIPKGYVNYNLVLTLFSYKSYQDFIDYYGRPHAWDASYSVVCATDAMIRNFCKKYGLSVAFQNDVEGYIAQHAKRLRNTPKGGLKGQGTYQTGWSFNSTYARIVAIKKEILYGENQKRLQGLGAEFYKKASKYKFILDIANCEEDFFEISETSQRYFLVGSSSVKFGRYTIKYSNLGLRNLISDAEKIGLALAIMEIIRDTSRDENAQYEYGAPLISCYFPLQDEPDDYAIRITYEYRKKTLKDW